MSAAPVPGTRNGRRLPTLMLVTSGALAAIVDIAEGLEVDAARMRVNLDATGGLIMAEAVTMALAEKIGKSDAHHLIEAASKKAVAREEASARRAGGGCQGHRASRRRRDRQNCSSRWPIRAPRKP